ncbi:hypothetical protein AB0A95_30770 [Micromonospora sp. NPDC049230]|uniref:hypothetical protein n=1 Tax=Micromonospora sp. NPDC049230 TaxID=3155502 RepID=UPI0033F6ECFE
MTTAHLDQDIDLDLDEPKVSRPGSLHRATRAALALALASVFVAALAGRLTLDGKALPAVFALVATLAACTLATRPTSN